MLTKSGCGSSIAVLHHVIPTNGELRLGDNADLLEYACLFDPTQILVCMSTSATVLVVEDNGPLSFAFVFQLKKLGIVAETAADGIEAIEKVRSGSFSLILMDIQMPKMDGIEATRKIRELERDEHRAASIIVAVTGGGAKRDRCIEAGMNAYFEKPLLIEGMKQIIEESAPHLLKPVDVAD